jgi:hypothetical protein
VSLLEIGLTGREATHHCKAATRPAALACPLARYVHGAVACQTSRDPPHADFGGLASNTGHSDLGWFHHLRRGPPHSPVVRSACKGDGGQDPGHASPRCNLGSPLFALAEDMAERDSAHHHKNGSKRPVTGNKSKTTSRGRSQAEQRQFALAGPRPARYFMLAIINDSSRKASQKERSAGDRPRRDRWGSLSRRSAHGH